MCIGTALVFFGAVCRELVEIRRHLSDGRLIEFAERTAREIAGTFGIPHDKIIRDTDPRKIENKNFVGADDVWREHRGRLGRGALCHDNGLARPKYPCNAQAGRVT